MASGFLLMLVFSALTVNLTLIFHHGSDFAIEKATTFAKPSDLRASGESWIIEELNLTKRISYLIVAPDKFSAVLQPLANWKTQKGEPALIMPLSNISKNYIGPDTAAKIKACITDFYQHDQTKWVLLAGDVNDVPTRDAYAPEDYPYDGDFVSCDSYYSDLDHDWDSNQNSIWGELEDGFDYHPEVYVGRLSANSETEMEHLVNNIVNYETAPPDLDGDWFGSALMAGAQLFFDEDWNNDSLPDYLGGDYNRFTHFVDDTVLSGKMNGTRWFLGETEGLAPTEYPVNESLTEENIMTALNSGFTLGAIAGHGNPSAMYRTLFTVDYDGDGLFDRNGTDYYAPPIDETTSIPFISIYSNYNYSADKLGFYYLGGCSVGTFDEPDDCLTETILKTVGIGCIGGSNVVWGEDEWYEREFGGWYSDGLTYRFFEQLMQFGQPGAALAHAKEDYVLDRANPLYYNADRPYFPEWENKTLKQFNLLGDPEVRLWLDAPKQMNVTLISDDNSTEIHVNDTDAPNKQLEKAVVTLSSENSLVYMMGVPANGSVILNLNATELGEYNLTIYYPGYLPYQQLVQIPGPEEPTDDTTTDDTTNTTDDNSDDDGGFKIPGFESLTLMGFGYITIVGLVIAINYRKRG